jgi:hypothetical protein
VIRKNFTHLIRARHMKQHLHSKLGFANRGFLPK